MIMKVTNKPIKFSVHYTSSFQFLNQHSPIYGI